MLIRSLMVCSVLRGAGWIGKRERDSTGMAMATGTIDMTRGVYRRIYGGAVAGERINAVSGMAERMFWRIHMVCDDFGNFPADPDRLRRLAFQVGTMPPAKQVQKWMDELAAPSKGKQSLPPLIVFYEVDGTTYGHIADFLELQPSNRNGKRRRDFPEPPSGVENEGGTNPGESRCIQIDPESSCPPETESEPETVSLSLSETEAESESGAEDDSLSARALGFSGSSSSGSPVRRRHQGHEAFKSAMASLIGRHEGGRHPPASKQFKSDATCIACWWSDIWPTDGDPAACSKKLDHALKLARMAKTKNTPMAWLTDRFKAEGIIA